MKHDDMDSGIKRLGTIMVMIAVAAFGLMFAGLYLLYWRFS